MVKLYRHDGSPVHPAHNKERHEVLMKAWDELVEKHGRPVRPDDESGNIIRLELEKLDKEFAERYPMSVEVEFPASVEELKKLVDTYNAPVCFTVEGDEVVGYLMG